MAGKNSIAGMLFFLIATPVSIALIFFLQAGFIFIVLGLMPALVAFFVDGYAGKPTYKCVLFCNLSGMAPTISNALHSENVAVAMQTLMAEPYSWVIVYGAAAAGYGLLLMCRILTQISLSIADQTRVEILTKRQKELVEEWGERVKLRQG